MVWLLCPLVTWNTPEPDRIGAIWLLRRFVTPHSRFHFIEPMTKVPYGTAFDLPDAEVRRTYNRCTFEVLLPRTGREAEPARASRASRTGRSGRAGRAGRV